MQSRTKVKGKNPSLRPCSLVLSGAGHSEVDPLLNYGRIWDFEKQLGGPVGTWALDQGSHVMASVARLQIKEMLWRCRSISIEHREFN